MPARPLLVFAYIALGLSIVSVVLVVSSYELSFQDPELLDWQSDALIHGTGFTLQDFSAALHAPYASRMRFISFFAHIVTLKARIAWLSTFPPHPTLGPMWFLFVVLGPLLLFGFLQAELKNRAASLVGVAIYLVSPGLLSGLTMLFHMGKPLTNVMLLCALWLSARMRPREFRYLNPLLLPLFALAPFVDETALFVVVVPIVWRPELFSPRTSGLRCLVNWALVILPTLGAIAIGQSLLSGVSTAGAFDLPAFLREVFHHERITLSYLPWTALNLGAAQSFAGYFFRVSAPVRWPDGSNSIDMEWGPFWMLVVAAALIAWALRNRTVFSFYARILILIALFVVFQGVILLFHPLLLVASGFYYGAAFSVLFASAGGAVFAGLADSGLRTGIRLVYGSVLYILMASVINFVALDESWRGHRNYKALFHVGSIPFDNAGDWEPVKSLALHSTGYYGSDVPGDSAGSAFSETIEMWRRWRRGDDDLFAGRAVRLRDFWLLDELSLASDPARMAKLTSIRPAAAKSIAVVSSAQTGFPAEKLNDRTLVAWGSSEEPKDVYAGLSYPDPALFHQAEIVLFAPNGRMHLRDVRVIVADEERDGTPVWRIVRSRLSDMEPFTDKVTVPPSVDGTRVVLQVDPSDPHLGPHRFWGIACLSDSAGDMRNYLPVGRGVYIRELVFN